MKSQCHKLYISPPYKESSPFRAKGLGEVTAEGVAPAVANAVSDATGVRIRLTAPHTGESVAGSVKVSDLEIGKL
jgi:CO/xanthine dehydrogenase Mo-binding subunit